MADTILDNEKVQQAGLPKIPRSYEKALGMFAELLKKANLFNSTLSNDISAKALNRLSDWMSHSIGNFFGKEPSQIGDDVSSYMSEPNANPPWFETILDGMSETPVETAIRLETLNDHLKSLRWLKRSYDYYTSNGRDDPFEEKSAKRWEMHNRPFVDIGVNGPNGDITWGMIDRWLGKDFVNDPVFGLRIDKPLPRHWNNDIGYEVEDE